MPANKVAVSGYSVRDASYYVADATLFIWRLQLNYLAVAR